MRNAKAKAQRETGEVTVFEREEEEAGARRSESNVDLAINTVETEVMTTLGEQSDPEKEKDEDEGTSLALQLAEMLGVYF
jgi:hypothetical protein